MTPAAASPEVLVVGGGLSGLLAARCLQDAGRRVQVWEAAPQPGGWARTLDWPGPEGEPGTLELGPQSLRAPEGSALMTLVRDLGLTRLRLSRRGPRWLLDGEGLRRWPSLGHTLGLGGGLRLLTEPFHGPGSGDASLEDFARRRHGRAFAEALLPPLVGSLLAAHPRDLDPLALPSLVRGDRFGGWLADRLRHGAPLRWTLPGGMGQLAQDLARRLDVRPATAVRTLKAEGGGWWVIGDGASVWAPQVILALPPPAAAALLAPLAPEAALHLEALGTTHLWVRHTRHAPTLPDLGLRVHPEVGGPLVGLQGRRQGPWLQVTTYLRTREEPQFALPGLGPVLQERWTEAALPLIPPGHGPRRAAILAALPPGLDGIGPWRWGPGLAELAEGAAAWNAQGS